MDTTESKFYQLDHIFTSSGYTHLYPPGFSINSVFQCMRSLKKTQILLRMAEKYAKNLGQFSAVVNQHSSICYNGMSLIYTHLRARSFCVNWTTLNKQSPKHVEPDPAETHFYAFNLLYLLKRISAYSILDGN